MTALEAFFSSIKGLVSPLLENFSKIADFVSGFWTYVYGVISPLSQIPFITPIFSSLLLLLSLDGIFFIYKKIRQG